MRILSEDKRTVAATNNWTVEVSGDFPQRPLLRSTAYVMTVAVSNDGRYVAVSPEKNGAVVVYRWNGKRWRVECDFDLPSVPAMLAWNECDQPPDLTMRLTSGERYLVYEWADGWKCRKG